jgi:hypothetical protein
MADKTKNVVNVMCAVIVTFITVGGVFLACGAVMGDVAESKADIKVLQAVDKSQANDIVALRIQSGKAQATAEATLATLTGIHEELKALTKVQAEQTRLQAINATKLESLIKDD